MSKNNIVNSILANQQQQIDVESNCILYNGEVFTFLDSGLTRNVYVNSDKTKVLKTLIDVDGKDYNKEEYEIYNNASDSVKSKLASTELVFGGLYIEQEYCENIKDSDKDLSIKDIIFSKKCRNEVGWTSDGRLVCFDLDEYMKY